MQTEDLIRGSRAADARGVSPALQALAPPPYRVTDARGRVVPLSSAGLVLYFGRKYRLHVDDDEKPRWLTVPYFAERLDAAPPHDGALRFFVRRQSGWLRLFKWPYEMAFGAIEAQCIRDEKLIDISFPVVARTAWSIGIVLLLSAGAVAGWLLGQGQSFISEAWKQGAFPSLSWEDWWPALRSHPYFWVWPASLAALNPVLAFASHCWRLWFRSQQLEAEFRQRYQGRE